MARIGNLARALFAFEFVRRYVVIVGNGALNDVYGNVLLEWAGEEIL